jgi:hypothetical protein
MQDEPSDDEIYRAYLDGINEARIPDEDDPLLLPTAYAMGVMDKQRRDFTCKAAVVETARRILTVTAADAEGGDASAAQRRSQSAKPAPAPKKKVPPRTSAVRRAAGTKPVACPAHGCESPGIRSKMNFCTEHAAALSEEERLRLRQEQRANHPGQDAAAAEEAK